MKKILVFSILSFFGCSVFAETFSSRYGTQNYYIDYTHGDYAIHTTYTNPIKPNQPVFLWRTHTKFDGSRGGYTVDGKLIGYTDSNGVLSIVVEKLPFDIALCGWFRNERVAVGSKYSPQSNSLNFTISLRRPNVGPFPPGC